MRSVIINAFLISFILLTQTVLAIDYPYQTAEPQQTGWPLSDEERAYVMRSEHDRRPGREANKHLPAMWPVVPSAGNWGGTSWLDTHAKLVEHVKENAGPCDVLLVGDSITIQWGDSWKKHFPDLKAINIGIGGDKTQNVLWRLDHGGVDGLQPKAIVLMIGNNNMFFTPETGIEAAAKGIEMCVNNLRDKFPKTPIIVTKILPAHQPGNRFYEDIKKTNTTLDSLKLDSDPKVKILDLADDFINGNGTIKSPLFTPDNIHLSLEGYAVYADKLEPLLDALLRGKVLGVQGATPKAAAVAPLTAAEPSKPNILFIIADDLATRLGCYGDKTAITPSLDRLAAEGVVFTKAYCQGAVCTPSRTSFMLGLNTRHAKANHFIKHPETMTMGRWFREHGYQTCAIGKIDHDDPNDAFTDPKAWDVRVKREDMAPKLPTQNTFFDEDLGQQRKRVSLIRVANSPEAMSDWVRAERLIQFFDKERDASKPFFAAIGFHTPHVPWDSTRAIYDQHDPAKFTPETTPADATPLPPGSLLREPGMEMSEAHHREGLRAYYAAVTTLDQQIGRLLDHLRAKGQLEKTLVVFTSDHGYHLGWRGQWCKHSIDEQVLRVPLIVCHPQGAKNAKASGIVELLDIFPTFCDFAGLPAPDSLDGKSFLTQLHDPKVEGKPGAFCEWGNGRTVRTQRWRFTERRDGTTELYDHSTDTAEYYNVITNPEHAQVVKRLHGMLDKEFGPMTMKSN